jgi:DNA-binding NarL/FixJ family response regulator
MALDELALVCAEASDRRSAVEAVQKYRPDVVLIGRSLPGDGIRAVREISDAVPHTSIVVLADRPEINDLLMALRAGAIGYMPVGFEPAQLRRAIAAVRTEQAAIPRSMVRELVDEIRSFDRVARGQLTLRERQVLAMVRRGDSTARIAQHLDISPITVRRHISVLVRKAGVAGRAELAATLERAEPSAGGVPLAIESVSNRVRRRLDSVADAELGENVRQVVLGS